MNKTKSLMLGGTLMAALTLSSFGAGPLTPPGTPGQPAADMPSLVEIKAAIDALAASSGGGLNGRTAIPAQTATYTIATPGNYVLTGNVTVATGDGIVISASDVTLDLNGFTISSTSGTKSGNAITLSSGVKSVTVKNGRLTAESASGFSHGIILDLTGSDPSDALVMEDLTVKNLDIALSSPFGNFGNHSIALKRVIVTNGSIQLYSTVTTAPTPFDVRYGTAIECQVSVPGSGGGILRVSHAIHCTVKGGSITTDVGVGNSPP